MKKSDPLFRAGHRKRLGDKLLADKVTDYELLEFILTLAVPRRNMRLEARRLLDKFGTFHSVMCAPVERLMMVEGVGPAIVKAIKAMHRAATLQCYEQIKTKNIFKQYEQLTNYCKFIIGGNDVEEFHVLYLRGDMSVIEDKMHSIGSDRHALIYPLEILRMALYLRAESVLLVHNHPSGNPAFSEDDIKTTAELYEMLEKNGINLFDHFVVTANRMISIMNTHLLDKAKKKSIPE